MKYFDRYQASICALNIYEENQGSVPFGRLIKTNYTKFPLRRQKHFLV